MSVLTMGSTNRIESLITQKCQNMPSIPNKWPLQDLELFVLQSDYKYMEYTSRSR